jgi:hypothetical protein
LKVNEDVSEFDLLMEQEGLSLDRHLIHVFVAAIDVEITAAQAGELERGWCHRRNDESKPRQDLYFDDCIVRVLYAVRKRKARRRKRGREAHVGMGTASSLISNGWEGCKRTARWAMWEDRAGDAQVEREGSN